MSDNENAHGLWGGELEGAFHEDFSERLQGCRHGVPEEVTIQCAFDFYVVELENSQGIELDDGNWMIHEASSSESKPWLASFSRTT
jgi:hypothetical protein